MEAELQDVCFLVVVVFFATWYACVHQMLQPGFEHFYLRS